MLPRLRVPGGTYLLTRTTSDRRFFLKPTATVTNVIHYCLFRAAKPRDVLLHGIWVESNHVHLLVTDTSGTLSDFMHWFDRHVALCLLDHYRKRYPHRTIETIWAAGSFNETLLVTPEAVLEAYVYGATNAVKDGLVHRHHHWPGMWTTPRDWLAGPQTAARPALYFKQDDDAVATIEYEFTVPRQLADRNLHSLVCDVERMIEDEERAFHTARGGKGFMGTKTVLARHPLDAPKAARVRTQRKPTVKAGKNQSPAYKNAIRAVRAFREAYRAARREFCRGIRCVFPAGTLLLRQRYAVSCVDADFGAWCVLGRVPS